jgi:hypothetical protein
MKKKNLVFTGLLLTFLFSCQQEEFQTLNEDVYSLPNTEEVQGVVVVVEDGRLSFESQGALDAYLNRISELLENNKGNVLNKSPKSHLCLIYTK